MVGSKYWSVYRANAVHEDGVKPVKIVVALEEIERVLRAAFPVASNVTARADASDVLVSFVPGQKPISVHFDGEALDTYRRFPEPARQEALRTLRLVCVFAFAREYIPDHDPVDPFVIDGTMALSGTIS